MSFILDALKKSDSERQRRSGPALFDVKVAPPRARLPIWAVALGVLLGVNLLALIWFLTRPTPDTAASATLASSAAPVATTTPSQPLAPAPAAAAADQRFNPPLIEDRTLADATPVEPAASGNPADFLPAVPPPAGGAPDSPAARVATAHTTPGLATRDDLVNAGQSQIPPAKLSLHVFDANPAKRFAFINGQRVVEGETMASGLRVEEIVADGVILSFRGTKFLSPIQ